MNLPHNAQHTIQLLCKQLYNNFTLSDREVPAIAELATKALLRTVNCLSESTSKYCCNEQGDPVFDPFITTQYSMFLYFASHEAALRGNHSLADRIYYLNKMLNGCDLFHQICLPDIFLMEHPVAAVMGRAKYSNYFIFQQSCTVGGNHGRYPSMGEFVWLFANATVIGNTTIGNNCFISANTFIKDETIPDNTIVFGQSPKLTFKRKPPEYFYKSSPFRIHTNRL